jgi:hypothetical protein
MSYKKNGTEKLLVYVCVYVSPSAFIWAPTTVFVSFVFLSFIHTYTCNYILGGFFQFQSRSVGRRAPSPGVGLRSVGRSAGGGGEGEG